MGKKKVVTTTTSRYDHASNDYFEAIGLPSNLRNRIIDALNEYMLNKPVNAGSQIAQVVLETLNTFEELTVDDKILIAYGLGHFAQLRDGRSSEDMISKLASIFGTGGISSGDLPKFSDRKTLPKLILPAKPGGRNGKPS